MTTWFTADTHFGHSNIIKYSNRPFASKDEMDSKLIENWNTEIGQYDTVYHLGDFCFRSQSEGQSILDRLNGKKHLIVGNHDKVGVGLKGWESIDHYKEVSIDGQFIVLCHYAMRVWSKSHHGAWQLYGHSHGSLPDDPNALSFDVGVDCHNYQPLNMDDIRRIMKKKTWKAIDHHGRE
jgi:calcineurin-like phosphoesterase family protein